MMFTNLLTKRTVNEDGSSSSSTRSNGHGHALGTTGSHTTHDTHNNMNAYHSHDVEKNDVYETTNNDYMDHKDNEDDSLVDVYDENDHPSSSSSSSQKQQQQQQQQQQQALPPVSFYFYHSPTAKSTNPSSTSFSSGTPSNDHHTGTQYINSTDITSTTSTSTSSTNHRRPPHASLSSPSSLFSTSSSLLLPRNHRIKGNNDTSTSTSTRSTGSNNHHSHSIHLNDDTKSLLHRQQQQPPPRTLLPPLQITKSRKTTTLLDDCESGISMNCRCRKATMIMMTFFVAILVAFYSNISLVIKLGAAHHQNPFLLDDTYHHLQQMMMISSPSTVVDNNNKKKKSKGRVDTAMIGDDDDPLEGADDDTNNNINGDDGTALDSITSDADMKALSSSKKNMNIKSSSNTKTMNMKNKKYMKQRSNSSSNERQQQHKGGLKRNIAKANIQDIVPTPESMSANASFSACLLIKDDNEILSEWIAYHYHTIKLRHLIVAVDPLSSESPTIILAKWKLQTDLNIRLWHDEHYMPDDFMETGQAPPNFIATETDLKNSKMRTESIIEISNHRYRQRVFLSSCLRSMRAEGNSWVIHIDTDEYVVPSKLLRQMKPRYIVIPPIEQPGSVLSLIQQVVEKTARNVNYPCISMLRVLFGSVESSIEEQNVGVPEQYNATAFESLRWRYHALPHHAELHGNPKVILDVQAIPAKYFEETIVFSIHRPVREYCPKNSELAFSNFRKQPIAVNHYLGSWERYSGRNDKRRSRDKYDMKATVNRGHDDGLRTWLNGFVESVGPSNAAKLLGDQYLSRNYRNNQYRNDTSNYMEQIVVPPSEEETSS